MDALDKYKKSWKTYSFDSEKISKEAIYKMIHKKSSSVVKWIFIIGIIEFLFWGILSIFSLKTNYMKIYNDLHLEKVIYGMSIFHYILILTFLTLFFLNYKRISTTDNTKLLIKNIKKVKKTVNIYVYYNVVSYFVFSIVLYSLMLSDIEKLKIAMGFSEKISNNSVISMIIITQLIVIILFVLFLWILYKVIYGRLLKKLNENHKELNSLEN